ncbi:MAG: fimbrillin family protein [Bacteroidales bacterium]|nr:fimbrillin family protein [Bacteroidales bacterium]
MKYFLSLACTVILGLIAVSCNKEVNPNEKKSSDGIIHVRVDAEGTKASVITQDGLKTNPGKFIMEAYVDRDVYDDGKRHTPVGNAYFGPTTTHPENVIYNSASSESSKWELRQWDKSGNPQLCYWVSSEGTMSFWSRVKSQNGLNDITIDTGNSALYTSSPNADPSKGVKMVFDYSLPTPTLEADATNQEDLIFAYWQDVLVNRAANEDDEPDYPEKQDVWVHFYHSLSQIRFAFRTDDDSFVKGIKIKSIALGDVASGGTCTFWGNLAMQQFTTYDKRATDEHRDVASLFSWTDLKDKKTYSQDYGITVKSTYSTETEYAGWEKVGYPKGETPTYYLYTCRNVFMMIPQTLSSPSSVRLTVVDETKPAGQQEQEFIAFINDTWEAGKYYTYKLNYKNDQILFTATLVDWGDISQTKVFDLD